MIDPTRITPSLLCGALALSLGCGGAPAPKTPVEKADGAGASAPAEEAALAAPDRSALPTPGAQTEWTPPAVTSWTMPNGITVWHLQQTQAPLISLRLVLPTGASTDPAGKAGATSLMVDLLDEGAGEYTALTLGEAFQRLATDYGADVATDGISFRLDLLADKLAPSLALLSDVLRQPKLAADEFQRRKDQTVASLLTQEADPQYGAAVVGRRVLFGGGYGGMPANGVRRTVEGITLADVKARYAAAIQPKGATLIAVGAIDRPTLEKALNDAFGDWQGAPNAAPAKLTDKAMSRAIYWVDYPGSAQSVVAAIRRAPGAEAGDYFPAAIFNRVLAGAFTSRLNLNLREDKGYTYGARGYFNRWARAGFYTLSAKVKADTTRASLDEMIAELKGIRGEKPISQEERDQAVGGYLLGFPGRFENMGSVAGQFASLVLDGHGPEWYGEWPGKVAAVDLAAAKAAAQTYTDPGDFVLIVAGDYDKLHHTMNGLGLTIQRFTAQGAPVDPGKRK